MIIDHNHHAYREKWNRIGKNKYNGAFYYSKEIVKNIIPRVKTDRNWITVNIPPFGCDHAIVFIHNNMKPENYAWLKHFDDLILVCGIPETRGKVEHLGKAIYLPLSIDLEYIQQFKVPEEERSGAAFVGRKAKRKIEGVSIPDDIDIIEGLRRQDLLREMARYEIVYAVGRTAIEAKALGCEVKAYDPRYPDPDIWIPLDNRAAAALLQRELDYIDGEHFCGYGKSYEPEVEDDE